MTSKLASVVADRGKVKHSRVGGLIVHTTGSSIVEQARKVGADPEAFAVDFYTHAEGKYPHYLIAHDGSTYSFCDEMKQAAHAAWSDAERDLYFTAPMSTASPAPWMRSWINTLGDGAQKTVDPEFYRVWRERWQDEWKGRYYISPLNLLRQITETPEKGPNHCTIGVEMLDSKPFSTAQHEALASLFADICKRHELLDPKQIAPGTLPQPWLCTHSDVSPLRRYQRRRDGTGFPWDPRTDQLDWALLGRLLK